ncbi:MAG: FG-GAP repeat domain-containing protein [Pirellulaceae bacterium]
MFCVFAIKSHASVHAALTLFWIVFAASHACVFADETVVDDSARWKRHVVYDGAPCMTAVAGEFSGDDQTDIICSAGGETILLVAPDWKRVTLGKDAQHKFIHSEAYDVDDDGDTDYIAARYNPGLIVWFEQPDSPVSHRWEMHMISDRVHGIHGLLKGDVDGDGKTDLLATSAQPKPPYPESLVWLRPKQPLDVEDTVWECNVMADRDAPGLTHYLGFGDVNGDGRPDVATGAKGGPTDASGKGEWFAWWEAPKVPTETWTKRLISDKQPGATNIHPVDVNNDGIVDFIASRGHGRGVVWFEGPSWKEHPIHASIQEPHCLVAVDMDNDGDIDAATCAFGDKLAAWFENDGHGTFTTHIVGRDQEAYDIRAVDLNGDKHLDLLVAGRASNNVVWYENPGK